MASKKMKILFSIAFTAFALEAGEPAKAPAVAAATAGAAAKPAAVQPTVAVSDAPKPAATGKSCEDVKAAIDAKIKAKGVKAFTLEIVGKDEVKDAKVVGNCEAGAKRITYKRG